MYKARYMPCHERALNDPRVVLYTLVSIALYSIAIDICFKVTRRETPLNIKILIVIR